MSATPRIANVLTIAGSDPSGGAGIQADLKTFSALGTYATSVITALTAQNTHGVTGVHPVPGDFIAAQLDTLLDDVSIDAVKIGMVASREVAEILRERLTDRRPPWIVLDPVMVAKSGDLLVDDDGIRAVRDMLVPLADLVTPNLPEAAVLLGAPIAGPIDIAAEGFHSPAEGSHASGHGADHSPYNTDAMEALLPGLLELGAPHVLLKGGHLRGGRCPDLLGSHTGGSWLEAERVVTANLHGTGCTLSSAIAAHLARGESLISAVHHAKIWLSQALHDSHRLDVGDGRGPVHHFHAWW